MEQLPGLWSLTPYGAVLGMMVFLFLSLAKGWVIPRASHERELAAANKRGDDWKESSEKKDVLIGVLTSQNGTLIEATKTPAEFFGTVMREGGQIRVVQQESSTG